MDTEDKKLTLPQRLAKLEEELKENQGILQTYMLSPSPDFRPAEEERILVTINLRLLLLYR